MTELDNKINETFPGLVVRKDLVKKVKGNAIVPSYVLEYLLGQYCATNEESTIQSGIETVKDILAKHYVHRGDAALVRSTIKERGRHKVIDKITVDLNDKKDAYQAVFSNLGLKEVIVDSDTVKKNPKLLVGGVWCIVDMEYKYTEDKQTSPWLMESLKPIQLASFDLEEYKTSRAKFSLEEWIDLLIQSMGFNPEQFSKRGKLLQLIRLIPYSERNYNMVELGPKGTGKSHIYSEFSPHGILISGGEVTVPKLFVNNGNGKIGLVGYWDTVAFDEFAGKKKKAEKALVDIMKNYMANKSFSRGIETLGAEASMVFIGNTSHNLPFMLKHSNLFDDLPEQYYDSAFLDRLHYYIPGWEVDIIRSEMFSDAYGFVVDYLAEILRTYRNFDHSNKYQEFFTLSNEMSTRDKDGINKTFSGMYKILFPHEIATKQEIEEILRFSIEGRKRVKNQLMKIDSTYADVVFAYTDNNSNELRHVRTLEEGQYPQFFSERVIIEEADLGLNERQQAAPAANTVTPVVQEIKLPELTEGHVVFFEDQKGVSYKNMIVPYLRGAAKIDITDAYIRNFFQIRNLFELIRFVIESKNIEDEVEINLLTTEDFGDNSRQAENLDKIVESVAESGIRFNWKFDNNNTIHARHITTDTGWKILLDRGLDIFQHYDGNNAFSVENAIQEARSVKAFEVTYIKND